MPDSWSGPFDEQELTLTEYSIPGSSANLQDLANPLRS
jgi:hypothetical protein